MPLSFPSHSQKVSIAPHRLALNRYALCLAPDGFHASSQEGTEMLEKGVPHPIQPNRETKIALQKTKYSAGRSRREYTCWGSREPEAVDRQISKFLRVRRVRICSRSAEASLAATA